MKLLCDVCSGALGLPSDGQFVVCQHCGAAHDIQLVRKKLGITQYEGKRVLLYEDPSNPYESIYIHAEIKDHKLLLTDSEIEHGPDGGSSMRAFEFDAPNTEIVFAFLSETGNDPLLALHQMLSYENRTSLFIAECKKRGIAFVEKFYL